TATLFAVRGIGSQITKLTSLMLRGRCLNVPSFLEDIPPLICEFALSEANENIPLVGTATKGNLTISTAGSYVDFGIGAYLRAKFDKNWTEEDVYVFEVRTSAYFESNVQFTISGEYEAVWSKDIELMDMIDVEIAHPYSAVAKVVVGFQPVLEVGAKGDLKISMDAHAHSRREGEIGFRFSSMTHSLVPNGKVSFKEFPENGVTFVASVKGEAFIIPRIAVRPKLIFLRVAQPLSFGEIRGGVKVNSIMAGQVQTDFVVANEGYNIDILGQAELGLDVGVSALIDYILQIRLGKKEFWSMEDYEDLYESPRLIVFDWQIGLLKPPKYTSTPSANGGVDVQFEVEGNEHPTKIQYYYGKQPFGSSAYSAALLDFRNTADHLSGNTLHLDDAATLYVQAVLENKDISESVWMKFGTSLSPVASFDIDANIPTAVDPPIIPDPDPVDPAPPTTPGTDPIDPQPDPVTPIRDETCDLWDIRYTNWPGANCSIKEDPDERAKCETYNQCVRSITCTENWDQAQAELDACTMAYLY
ncbi:MAG: hypothetical protein KJ950_05030, partial [Proteobacteria bacterium]|nr:hypothetical protein [Pseudomonadota bacterium]MBU1686977.1 hypothetical protein [Pseudomonadota bacterium]